MVFDPCDHSGWAVIIQLSYTLHETDSQSRVDGLVFAGDLPAWTSSAQRLKPTIASVFPCSLIISASSFQEPHNLVWCYWTGIALLVLILWNQSPGIVCFLPDVYSDDQGLKFDLQNLLVLCTYIRCLLYFDCGYWRATHISNSTVWHLFFKVHFIPYRNASYKIIKNFDLCNNSVNPQLINTVTQYYVNEIYLIYSLLPSIASIQSKIEFNLLWISLTSTSLFLSWII